MSQVFVKGRVLTMREPTHAPPAANYGSVDGIQLLLSAGPEVPGPLGPSYFPRGGRPEVRLSDSNLSQLVEQIEGISAYVREVEAHDKERERLLSEMYARTNARIVEADARVRAAEERFRSEQARANVAEERVQTLEQWLMRIAEAMAAVEKSTASE